MKKLIAFLQILSPSIVANYLYYFMSNPQVRKLRIHEEDVLNQSTKGIIYFKEFTIQKYTWGNSTHKKVLLVHGWEGQAGNFMGLVQTLLNKNYQVVAFDAPSHGHSSKGETNMFEFSELIEQEIKNIKPCVIISHSFGSVTTANVLRKNKEIMVDHWLMVTTPYTFRNWINMISQNFRINEKVKNKLIHRIEAKIGENIDNINMKVYCQGLSNVNNCTIAHSKTDKVLPIAGARKVNEAIKGSRLVELDDLGHYSILWSDELKEVIETV